MSIIAALLGLAVPAAPAAEEIVVTGRGLDASSAGSGTIVTVSRERLTASASNRLEDVLGDIAGLQSFRRSDSRSANPTSQGITLRGLGGNASSRALLILDGVPQADPFGGWIAFPLFAPDRLGAVRVQRGGGGTSWGSGAMAGLIELTSATPDQLSPLTASVALGARGAVEARAGARLERGIGFGAVSLGYARGSGFVPIVAADRGPADRTAGYEQADAAVRAAIRVAPATEAQILLQAFIDRRDRGLAFTQIESDGADVSLRLVGSGRWRWSALGYVQTRRFASRFVSVNEARTTVTPTLDQYEVPGLGLGGRLEIEPPLGRDFSLRLGADLRETRGTTKELFSFTGGRFTRRREAGGATRTIGAFADGEMRLGTVSLGGAVRLDAWRISDGRLFEVALAGGPPLTDTAFAHRSGMEATGRIGLRWSASDRLELRGAIYRSWRLPTPNELYRPFRAGADATAANPLLQPERLAGVEAGADLVLAPWLSLSVLGFDNRLEDAIANVTVAAGPGTFAGVGFVSAAGFFRRRDNLEAIRSRGVELDASARFGAVSVVASYALADARVIGGSLAPALTGRRPAQVPRHQASLTAAWSARRARAAATLRYVAAQFEDDQNGRNLGDAFTVDMAASAPLLRGLALEARVENAFDATVAAGFSGAALERVRPRAWWIGLRAAFD